ncbi:MAG: hypothetical protein ACKVS9_19195 [Phycisphaerae bacterium]
MTRNRRQQLAEVSQRLNLVPGLPVPSPRGVETEAADLYFRRTASGATMRRVVTLGLRALDIGLSHTPPFLEKQTAALDPNAAAAELLSARLNATHGDVLRRILSEAHDGDATRQTDQQVAQRIARLLATGVLSAFVVPPVIRSGGRRVEAPPAPAELTPIFETKPETTWIEIQLLDSDCEPLPNERFRVKMPDGVVREGRLNYLGKARVNDVDGGGNCQISFPDLDADAWHSNVVCPAPPPPQPKFTFVEFALVDMEGEPVPFERYRVTLADGSVQEGQLDDKGKVRYDGLLDGDCKITFPELDSESWEAV